MWLDPNRGYDIIGDVHGCANSLCQLLEQMGYKYQQGVWRHANRVALFLGDVVDRGPRIRESLHIVKNMVEAGQAICVMGNHEFYSLGWFTPREDEPTEFIRSHHAAHHRVIAETLKQFEGYADEWQGFLQWFYTLPLFIENERFRLVHACWDQRLIDAFKKHYPCERLNNAFLQRAIDYHSVESEIIDRLLLGLKLPFPDGQVSISNDGYIRRVFRAKFWAEEPITFGDVVFQPDALPKMVVNEPLTTKQKALCTMYSLDDPLLFVGHYWCRGEPAPLQQNIACLDYSAVKYGKLVAYRLDDELYLDPNKFVWVDVVRPY